MAEVASGHPEVSAAAAEVLREGGNAFDAVIAAAFTACVAEPMFASLGGGGFLLAHEAEGETRIFDFFVDTPGRGAPRGQEPPHFVPVTVRFPSSEQVFNIGLGSVAVPGVLRGLLHVQRRMASLPLARLIEPALLAAREGLVLNAQQAYGIALLQPIVTSHDDVAALYAPGGQPHSEGTRVTNPALADFLETLPRDGDREFYEGAIALAVVREMRGAGGRVTAQDLASYRVIEREALEGRYRHFTLRTNPPPCVGGGLLLRGLAGLEARGVRPPHRSVEERCDLADALERIERERVAQGAGGTTHISVRDAQGAAASLSLSNGEGAGVLAPGTGIQLNNMLGEEDLHPAGFHQQPPGERVGSMMCPTLVLEGDAVRLVLGSGGSKRIRSAITQVLTAVLDAELPLERAVAAPRLHWDGRALQLEPGLAEEVEAALGERWPVNRWNATDLYFGGVHAVAPGEAAGDPRRDGAGIVEAD